VDLEKGSIKVRYSVRGGKRGTPKSGTNRLVPIGQHLVGLLKAWRAKNPKAELAVPALPRKPNKSDPHKLAPRPATGARTSTRAR
jgi:hypothetical protein